MIDNENKEITFYGPSFSPWKDYKKEKPKRGVEVLAFNSKWIDPDFNPKGIRIGFLNEDGFVTAYWWDEQDGYVSVDKDTVFDSVFYKCYPGETEPEFWMEIPKCDKRK